MSCSSIFKNKQTIASIKSGDPLPNNRLFPALHCYDSRTSHTHFSAHCNPANTPPLTNSTCVAILRTLAIRNDRGLSHVCTFKVHISCWNNCFRLFRAFCAYVSEKPAALTSLTCWDLTLFPCSTSYQPLGQLPCLPVEDCSS